MKIIASDYDGTLNQNRIIAKRDIDAIKAWRAAGNQFGVVTGRGLPGILHEMNYYSAPFDFLICNNGCALYDGKPALLEQHAGKGELLPELCRFLAEKKGLHVTVSSREILHHVRYEGQTPKPEELWISMEETSSIPDFTQVDTHFATGEEAGQLAAAVNRQFEGRVTAYQNGACVDIVPFGVSKSAGVRWYLARLGLPENAAVTVGDNFNDLDMLLAFEGYAITSGREEVAKQVGRTCDNIADLVGKLIR